MFNLPLSYKTEAKGRTHISEGIEENRITNLS